MHELRLALSAGEGVEMIQRRAFPRGNKFSASPLRCRQNVMHQSTLEARRCDELHLMQQGGLIKDLRAHPQARFSLDVDGHHIADYLADFVYFDNERNARVVEDTKGMVTEVFRLKAKLMVACHGVDVELVRHAGKSKGWR
jgi:hypothetical protein